MRKTASNDRATKRARRSILRRFAADTSGSYVVITAIALPAMLGTFGMMSEVATWYAAKQYQQEAADSAAFSAAVALSKGEQNKQIVARGVAAANGYAHNDASVKVAFNNPPLSGPKAGNSGAVEVIITTKQPSTFSNAFGLKGMTISARSVAVTPGKGCVLALNPTASGALNFMGSTTVNLNDCSIHGNSTDPTGMNVGGSATVNTLSVNLSGGISTTAGLTTTQGIHTYQSPMSDPLAGVPMPTVGGCDKNNYQAGTEWLDPGVYCGGIKIKSNATTNLRPGIYIIAGGNLEMTSTNATLNGSGVTFIFTQRLGNWGVPKLTGGTINLTAPTTGAYAGILMYQDRATPTWWTEWKLTGGTNQTLGGIIYAPKTTVGFFGGANNNGCTQLIADQIQFIGNSNLALNCSGYNMAAIGGNLSLSE